MRRRWLWCLMETVLLFLVWQAESARGAVVLSEVMFDPAGSEFYDEFVEVFNASETEPVDLGGWTIGDGSEEDGIEAVEEGTTLGPRQFGLIMDPGYLEKSATYDPLREDVLVLTIDDGAFGKSGWSNGTPEPVILRNAYGDTVATYVYSIGNRPGRSDEKIRLEGGDGPENWADSEVDGGTPGRPNSVSPLAYDVAIPAEGVTFSPSIPEAGQDVEILVEVRNAGTEPTEEMEVVACVDDREIGREVVGPLEVGDFVVLRIFWREVPSGVHLLCARAIFGRDEDISDNERFVPLAVRFAPRSVVINEVMFAPEAGGSEWVEVFNPSGREVDLRYWTMHDANPSSAVEIADTPVRIPPEGYAVLVADYEAFSETFSEGPPSYVVQVDGWPTLNDAGDAAVLKDPTGARVDSVAYDPGRAGAGVSLERIGPEMESTAPDNWAACVSEARGTPGARNSVFIERVPTETDLSASPNPFDTRTVLSYRVPARTATVNLWIFDGRGRRVRKLLNGRPSGAERSVIWDGTDDDGIRVKMGIYILYLEALDEWEGVVHTGKGTVAVARDTD